MQVKKFGTKNAPTQFLRIRILLERITQQRRLDSMELTDIAPLETWRKLEQKINDRSGLNASVFNADGIRITDYVKWANKLCPVIKGNEKGQSYICSVAHQNIAAQAAKTGKAVIETCDAGMLKLVVPIFVNGDFLGVAGGCGCLEINEEIDTFMISKTTGINEEKLINLTEEIPYMTRDDAESLASYIEAEISRLLQT